MSYTFRVGDTTIGRIVPETCEAITAVLKEKHFKVGIEKRGALVAILPAKQTNLHVFSIPLSGMENIWRLASGHRVIINIGPS